MMRKMKGMLGVFAALLILLLAACGSNGMNSKEAGAQKQAEGSGVLEKVKSAGVMNVGIEGAYPPFNYFNNKNELEGFDVDITNEIAKRMGIKANFVATPWDTIIGGLLSKKYDMILSSMAITEERLKKVDFTEPYYHTGAQLFAPSSSNITDPTKINGKRVGVSIGTTFEKKANELGAEMVTYKNDLLAFQDLANGRIDGVITDKGVGARMIKEKGYPFKPIGDMLYKDKAGIALNKKEEAFKNELNKHLKDMLEDGTYEKISKKWFNEDIR
ncbi:ABC transporter substrate-binding protein [Aneurinibacillus sp. REN35]|uniref:ABC transporter substrate-binding protein n=1 Tax=Aneurinibacillus sp. REN35 TaxID=3237286 RepID=UPI003527D458